MRVITMVAFQPALLFHADAYGYLRIADHLQPSPYRPSFYPILLRLAYPFQSLVPVVVAQHLAGVLMAIVLYALLRRLGVGRMGGALGTAPLLLDAYQLNIEHYILSETLFQSLVVIAFALLVASKRPPYPGMAVAGLLLGLAGITRAIGAALIVPVVVYLLWKRVGFRRLAVCLIAFLIPLIAYATWFHATWGEFALTSRGPLILFGRVSPFANCDNPALPDYQRNLCDERPPSERPGTEFYVWRPNNVLSPLLDFEPPPGRERYEVLGEFARRIILAQPLDYARVVGGDLLHYFGPTRWEEPRDAEMKPWEFTESFDFGSTDPEVLAEQRTVADNPPAVIRRYAGGPEPTGLFGNHDPPELEIDGRWARFLDRYQDFVFTPGTVLALSVLLGVIGMVLRPGRSRSVRPECFLFTSTGFALLLAPAATAVFDYRYLIPALPLLSTAGVLGAHAIRQRAAQRGKEQPRRVRDQMAKEIEA